MRVIDMALNHPRYGFPARLLHKCAQIYFYLTFAFSQDEYLKKWGNGAEIVKIRGICGSVYHEAKIVYRPIVLLSIDENSLQECNP